MMKFAPVRVHPSQSYELRRLAEFLKVSAAPPTSPEQQVEALTFALRRLLNMTADNMDGLQKVKQG